MTEQGTYFETNSILSFIYEESRARCWMRLRHLSRAPNLFSMPVSLKKSLGNGPRPGLSAKEGDEGEAAPECSCG